MISLLLVTASAPLIQAHDPFSDVVRAEHSLYSVGVSRGAQVRPVGDLDGDGLAELVVELDRVLLVRRGGDGGPFLTLVELGHPGAWDVGPDLDGDGAPEVVIVAPSGGGVAVQVVDSNDGTRRWTTSTLKVAPTLVVWAGDLDGDGVADVAMGDTSGGIVKTVSGATGKRLWRCKVPANMARLQAAGDRDGDGVDDLLADRGRRNLGPTWISGKTGQPITDPAAPRGTWTFDGDLDGDGKRDGVLQLGGSIGSQTEIHLSAAGDPVLCTGPDYLPDDVSVRMVGDVDGDGVADLAQGDCNFNLPDAAQAKNLGGDAIELEGMSLAAALKLESKPWSVSMIESGCVWVFSGATGAVIMGIYGEPGTATGLGREVFRVGDQDGDGRADLGLLIGAELHVFGTRRQFPADVFQWLPGHWLGEMTWEGTTLTIEEVWLPEAAGALHAVARTYIPGEREGGSFEFLRIERDGDAVVLQAQPSGEPPTPFQAVEQTAGSVLFQREGTGLPTWIRYTRVGDELRAELGETDQPPTLSLSWRLKVQ